MDNCHTEMGGGTNLLWSTYRKRVVVISFLGVEVRSNFIHKECNLREGVQKDIIN